MEKLEKLESVEKLEEFETIERAVSPRADEILGKPFYVHDHGFVRLIDYLGNDSSVVQMARVSYGAGTKSVREDAALIRYLMRHEHTSPFEGVILKFHLKMPIFVARQWMRHRTASINETSFRYSLPKDEFNIPEAEYVAYQSTDNKQGRSGALPYPEALDVRTDIGYVYKTAMSAYNRIQEKGVARELARVVLPVGIYTEFYWVMNLHNLLHFLKLRMDPHAQKEIRDYADKVAECVRAVAPASYQAFEDYTRNAISLSATEQEILKVMIENGAGLSALDGLDALDLPPGGLGKGEWAELKAKLGKLLGEKQ